jgi:hypothetical protein
MTPTRGPAERAHSAQHLMPDVDQNRVEPHVPERPPKPNILFFNYEHDHHDCVGKTCAQQNITEAPHIFIDRHLAVSHSEATQRQTYNNHHYRADQQEEKPFNFVRLRYKEVSDDQAKVRDEGCILTPK